MSARPRLGFAGLGWIGAMRMDAVAADGRAVVAALCDASADRLAEAAAKHPDAAAFADYDAMLDRAGVLRLDGVVIATPNALHAPQAIAALERGLAVFCQKPLALNAVEARAMVDAARRANRRLAVDYSYRYTDGARTLRRMVRDGELGRVFSVASTFHNAYGPDKPWCHDPALAGGGALIDLGVHQIDLPLWLLDSPGVREVRGTAFRHGRPLDGTGIDDFAVAQLVLEGAAVVHLAVSWSAHAGADCVIRTTLFGTGGGAEVGNVDGSFFDFETRRFDGRRCTILHREGRAWMGRAILDWVDRLATSAAYDAEIERSVLVAEVVDAIYQAAPRPAPAGAP
ncbi:MAG TPA: Gfo/Idh/MocA family oxidoreductase [Longimicrobiales bacterium]